MHTFTSVDLCVLEADWRHCIGLVSLPAGVSRTLEKKRVGMLEVSFKYGVVRGKEGVPVAGQGMLLKHWSCDDSS